MRPAFSDSDLTRFVERAADALWVGDPAPLAVVRLGSLSHGGFSARFSDIDLGVLFAEPQPAERIERLEAAVAGLEPASLARRVSLFWSTPDFDWGRLRPIDRADLCDHGHPLRGELPADLPRPDRAAIRRDMVQGSLPYFAGKTRRFTAGAPTDAADFKELVRCLLYPARFIYTWRTGAVTGNDTAVQALAAAPIPDLALQPLHDALAVRHGDLADAALDRHRPLLPSQRQALVAWLDEQTADTDPSDIRPDDDRSH